MANNADSDSSALFHIVYSNKPVQVFSVNKAISNKHLLGFSIYTLNSKNTKYAFVCTRYSFYTVRQTQSK